MNGKIKKVERQGAKNPYHMYEHMEKGLGEGESVNVHSEQCCEVLEYLYVPSGYWDVQEGERNESTVRELS